MHDHCIGVQIGFMRFVCVWLQKVLVHNYLLWPPW